MNKQLSPFLQRYFRIITELICNQARKYSGIFKHLKKVKFESSNFNIHSRAAFFIILLFTPLICILFARSFAPWVKFQMFYLMVSLAATVLIAPHISKIPILRRRLHWADSLNQRQKAAITKFDLIQLHKVSQLPANGVSLHPYLERLTILALTVNCFDSLIPERSAIGAIPLAISIYLCLQLLLIILATNRKKAV